MRKITLSMMALIGALFLQSCTADSIGEIEADMEVYASDDDTIPDDPKDLPDDDEEGGGN